jgi:hypothetical protein
MGSGRGAGTHRGSGDHRHGDADQRASHGDPVVDRIAPLLGHADLDLCADSDVHSHVPRHPLGDGDDPRQTDQYSFGHQNGDEQAD